MTLTCEGCGAVDAFDELEDVLHQSLFSEALEPFVEFRQISFDI